MSQFLYRYNPVEPSTWFYLSSLLLIGLFFKFGRFWSVRNLDLVLLILLGPGLLLIYYGKQEAIHQHQLSIEKDALEKSVDAKLQTTDLNQNPELNQNTGAKSADPSPSAEESRLPDAGVEFTTSKVEPSHPSNPATEPEQPGDIDDKDQSVPEVAESKPEAIKPLPNYLRAQKYGFLWLFFAGGLLLARMLADPTMVRRPLLDPNLSIGGLTFIGCSLFVFLMANVVSRAPADDPMNSVLPHGDTEVSASNDSQWKDGPGCAILRGFSVNLQKVFSIVSHLVIVVGVVLISYFHFDKIVMGVGAATLYLMLPYTTIMTNQITHAVPASLLVLTLLTYRLPIISGTLLGFTAGLAYYPFFVLPLWLSFYWSRGLWRFLGSFLVSLTLLTVLILIGSESVGLDFRQMYGLKSPAMEGLGGIWSQGIAGWSPFYRIPALAAFVTLAVSTALWPAQKNFGTLLSCTTAIMVASQFWHGYGGGLFMAWYLPPLLLTIFRPNLEDRIALSVVKQPWIPKRFRRVQPA